LREKEEQRLKQEAALVEKEREQRIQQQKLD